MAVEILKNVHGRQLGLDKDENLVLGGTKLVVGHTSKLDQIIDLLSLAAANTSIPNAVGDGVTDDSAVFASAVTATAVAGGTLQIAVPLLINANQTIPSNVQLLFTGRGKIKPGANKTITINGSISAGAWQIFDVSNSGAVVTGPIKNSFCYTEWFGADNTGVADSTVAFNATCVLAHASNDIAIQLLGGTYTLTSTVILNGVSNGSFTHPNLLGASKKKTILSYAGIASGTPAIQLKGGSGQISGGIVRDITFLGDTTSIALEFMGQCGSKAINCLFSTNAVGVRWHNSLANTFTEFCTLEGCEWANACVLSMEYKVTSGNNSFHGSGPGGGAENVVNNNNGTVLKADGTGTFIYNAPCNMQVFATLANTTIFQNNNSVAPVPISFSGTLSIETNASQTVTLGAGAGVYFVGPVKIIGMTTATGANVVAGTFLRVKTVQVHADSSTSFTGGESGRTFNNVQDTTLVDCNMKNVHRFVDVNISFANYIKRYTLDVDFNGDGSTAVNPIFMEMTQNTSVATAAVIPRVLLDSTTGGSGSPNFIGNADGTYNIVSAFTNMTATGAFSGGETTVTFTGNWTHPTGSHVLKFSNGDIRTATLTNGSPGPFTLSSALSSAATTTVASTMWPSSGVTIQVYETQQSNGLQGAGHMTF